MKKLYAIAFLLAASVALRAQDIPLFTQKLTNSFLYNPSVAGSGMGSLTYTFRQSYGSIANAPTNNFLSVHTPLAGNKIGIGVNYFQDNVNFLKNNYLSAAFAYHLGFNETTRLSFGVSAEYNFLRLNGTTNSDPSDPVYVSLGNGELDDYDFSFGMMFESKFVRVGLAANRLATGWIKEDTDYILSNYYSGFVQGMIPMRGGKDLLEPYAAYRKFSENDDMFDVGLYYTFNEKLLAGMSMRKGNVAGVTVGAYLTSNIMIGYTREMFFNDIRNQVGSTNEFTLRLDFKKAAPKSTGNFKADYASALAYRRKTMATTTAGSRSPAELHKKQKKLAAYSPNKRYQNVKKLSHPTKPSTMTKMTKAQKKRMKQVQRNRRRR